MKKIIHTIGFIEDNDDIVIMGVIHTEFMRTYTLVMNSTINEYMFTDSSTKNSVDLAAWCRNAYESGWGYADNSFGKRTGDERIRCADNVGLIMGYVRYDAESKSFTDDIIDMYYTVRGGIDSLHIWLFRQGIRTNRHD